MENIYINFTDSDWEPKTGDSDSLTLSYNINNPSEISGIGISEGEVTVNISRSLQVHWKLDRADLEKVLGNYAKDHVISKAEDRSLTDTEEIQLTTYNSTDFPLFDVGSIDIIVPSEQKVYIPSIDFEDNLDSISIAGKIVDLRDSINALFGELCDNKLLSLTQERALFDLTKSCTTIEVFSHRVASLCSLVISIDKNAFSKVPGFSSEGGSIDRMGDYLRKFYPGAITESIMENLSKYNHLRRMYPIHSDRAKGVLPAFSYFDINYPIDNYQDAWIKLLNSYKDLLSKLLSLFKQG